MLRVQLCSSCTHCRRTEVHCFSNELRSAQSTNTTGNTTTCVGFCTYCRWSTINNKSKLPSNLGATPRIPQSCQPKFEIFQPHTVTHRTSSAVFLILGCFGIFRCVRKSYVLMHCIAFGVFFIRLLVVKPVIIIITTSVSAKSISCHMTPVDAQNSVIPGAIPQNRRRPVWMKEKSKQ